MLGKISTSIESDKLSEPISFLSDKKKTPAYKTINFLVELSQNGVDGDSFKKLYGSFEKDNNHWGMRTVSFYVQNYLNTHRIDHKDREKIYNALKIKYLPNS